MDHFGRLFCAGAAENGLTSFGLDPNEKIRLSTVAGISFCLIWANRDARGSAEVVEVFVVDPNEKPDEGTAGVVVDEVVVDPKEKPDEGTAGVVVVEEGGAHPKVEGSEALGFSPKVKAETGAGGGKTSGTLAPNEKELSPQPEDVELGPGCSLRRSGIVLNVETSKEDVIWGEYPKEKGEVGTGFLLR